MTDRNRAKAIKRIRDGQALLTRIERLRLIELEHEADELRRIEASLADGLSSGISPRLAASYADRIKRVGAKVKGLEVEAKMQADRTLAQASKEKSATRLLQGVERDVKQTTERKSLVEVIEAAVRKTSLP